MKPACTRKLDYENEDEDEDDSIRCLSSAFQNLKPDT
jgi:hypothetical protein